MPPQLPASHDCKIATVSDGAIRSAEGEEARNVARVSGRMPILFHGQVDQRSFALILALFAMAIMSILILTFIFLSTVNRVSSFSSSGQARAGILALSALNFIEGDCIAEIQNGSTVLVDTNSGVAVYWPTTNLTMLPYRMQNQLSSTTGIPNNLVKWSSGTYPFWASTAYYTTNGPIRAVAGISTTNASLNWHYVNSTLWNKPAFSTSNFPSTIVPEWVLMTRQGPYTNTANATSSNAIALFSNPAATNANYVIGRYAYVVYDEGGLLDVTAAGYPSNTFSGDPTDVGLKGSQGFADLGPNGLGLTAAQVSTLVDWRNTNEYSSTNTYMSYLTNYAPEFGFLQAATNDQVFVGRQDLIQFWTNANELNAPANLLQYVTTFSREANAPGWGPEHDANDPTSTNYWNGSNVDTPYDGNITGAGGTFPITENDPPTLDYAYHTDANLTTSYNRFFPNVRVKTAFIRLSGETAVVGEPLVKNRFDLTKLSWITYNNSPPSGITTNDIYNYFGLTRNSDGSWTYNHSTVAPPSGTASQTSLIMTLDQVASLQGNQAREPDFFELLQAAILRGGLGLVSGDPNGANNTNGRGTLGGEFYRVEAAASLTNPSYATENGAIDFRADSGGYVVHAQSMYQVIQIGANIIDQYSSDNFPTEIVLNNQHFYGIKNLPYINGIGDAALRISPTAAGSLLSSNDTTITGAATDQEYVHRWLTFALWNPHQNAANPPAIGPTTFRIAAWAGKEYPFISGLGNAGTGSAVGGIDYVGRSFEPATNGVTISPNTPGTGLTDGPSWIGFYLTNYANYFSDPTAISYTNSFTSDANNPTTGNMNDQEGRIATLLGWQRAGIYLGWSRSPDNPYKVPLCAPLFPTYANPVPASTVPAIATRYPSMIFFNSSPPTIYLQYEDINNPGTWHTYQEVHNIYYFYSSGADGLGDAYMEPNDPAWQNWTNKPANNSNTNNWNVDEIEYNTNAPPVTGTDPLATYQDTWAVFTLDPRTLRFSLWAAHEPTTGATTINTNNWSTMSDVLKGGAQGPHFTIGGGDANAPSWMDNVVAANNHDTVAGGSSYYVDRDSNRRTADSGGWTNATPLPAGTRMQRPLQLDRPFRSVAEIGYVFRDEPWKSLNLISANSADSALLDIFYLGSPSTGDKPAPDVIAGKLNINSAVNNSVAAGTTSNPVLQALFSQTLRDYQTTSGNPSTLNTAITNVTDSKTLTTDLVNYIKTNGPMVNIGDLPGVFPQVPAAAAPTPLYTGLNESSEAFIRALADSSSTRTWNLMIDIIAQSGKYSPTATSLNNFTVEGEKHYWLHVAIDRFTGQIVAQQLEPVMN